MKKAVCLLAVLLLLFCSCTCGMESASASEPIKTRPDTFSAAGRYDVIPEPTTDPGTKLLLQPFGADTEALAAECLAALENYFENGRYWNHTDMDTNGMSEFGIALSVTDTPCDHSAFGSTYCNVYCGATQDFFSYPSLMQCLGFASLISDLVFGTDAPVTEFYDFDDLRIGDHIRLVSTTHSVIVTDIDRETETITVAEVNADYTSCRIAWGRQITKAQLFQAEDNIRYFTRYV